MPIYEYTCKACGHETEIMHKISDPAPKKCPECGKPKLVKQMSATGFRLAGGGWYETDFKSGNMRNLVEKKTDKAEPAAAAPDKPAAAKPEAKPKTEAKKPSKKAA